MEIITKNLTERDLDLRKKINLIYIFLFMCMLPLGLYLFLLLVLKETLSLYAGLDYKVNMLSFFFLFF